MSTAQSIISEGYMTGAKQASTEGASQTTNGGSGFDSEYFRIAASRVEMVDDAITNLQEEVKVAVQDYITPKIDSGIAVCDATDRWNLNVEILQLRRLRHELFERILPQASALDFEPHFTELVNLGGALREFERLMPEHKDVIASLKEPFKLPADVKALFQKVRDTIPF